MTTQTNDQRVTRSVHVTSYATPGRVRRTRLQSNTVTEFLTHTQRTRSQALRTSTTCHRRNPAGHARCGRQVLHIRVKVKFRRSRLVVISGRATDSSSLAVGVFHDGKLRYLGQVGIAMRRAQAEQLDAFLATIRQPDSPFVDLDPGAAVAFVEPHVVLEVSYLEVTHAGTLRQPILDAVRPDVRAETVVTDAELAAIVSVRTSQSRCAPTNDCDSLSGRRRAVSVASTLSADRLLPSVLPITSRYGRHT